MGYLDKNLDLGNRNGVTPWFSTGGSTAGTYTSPSNYNRLDPESNMPTPGELRPGGDLLACG